MTALMYSNTRRLTFWENVWGCYRINRRGGQSFRTALRVALEVANIIEKGFAEQRPTRALTIEEQIAKLTSQATTMERHAEMLRLQARDLRHRSRVAKNRERVAPEPLPTPPQPVPVGEEK